MTWNSFAGRAVLLNVYFINLDRAVDRRAQVEQCFGRFAPNSVTLRRITAVPANEVSSDCRGSLSNAEKACILSHTKAVRASLERAGPAVILEDDATLGARGFGGLTALLESDNAKDLVFLNALITNTDFLFIQQYKLYRHALASRSISRVDMRHLESAGADAYIVHADAKRKILELIAQLDGYDVPYDILMKEWIHAGKLTASVTIPFVTSLSLHADQSQITGPNPDWNEYRRLFALDSPFYPEPSEHRGKLESAVAAFTDEHLKFLKLLLLDYSS